MKILKKISAVILGSVLLVSMPLQAETTVQLVGERDFVVEEKTCWQDVYDAPKVKITIENSKEWAGETKKIMVSLEDAIWEEALQISEIKGMDSGDIALLTYDHRNYQLNITIPSDCEDKVEIEIAILAKVTGEEPKVVIEPVDESNLMEKQEVLIGVTNDKKMEYKVQEIPKVIQEGNMASILFTELKRGALFTGSFQVTLELENEHTYFGDLEYISKQVNQDDTDYILEGTEYITYGGGFLSEEKNIQLKRPNKNNQKLTFIISGVNADEVGTVLLHSIPIICTSDEKLSEEIKVTIKGENILDSGREEVIATLVTSAYNEMEIERLEAEQAEKEKEATLEKAKKEEEEKREAEEFGVHFTIGKSSYLTSGISHEMDIAPFIWGEGYMMVPIRYVAQAFGVTEDEMDYNSGKVELNFFNRRIQLIVGSDIAIVNGIEIPMSTPLVNISGRTFIPIGEIAKILNIEKKWDNTNKTAIFY